MNATSHAHADISHFVLEKSPLPDSARVLTLRGWERVSEGYAMEMGIAVPDSDCSSLDLDGVIGERSTLVVGEERYHGIVDRAELVHAAAGHAYLMMRLAPSFVRLTHSRHSRMYTNVSIEAVVRDVLDRAEVDCELEFQLGEEHPVEEHVCQYRESDYDFLLRWLAREGIFFFFKHDGDKETLVLADDAAAYAPCAIASIPYHPTVGADVTRGRSLSTLAARHQVVPGRVVVRDYDYTNPSLEIAGEHEVEGAAAVHLVAHERRVFSPDDAARMARIGAERLERSRNVMYATGPAAGLRAGHVTTVTAHPDERIGERSWVVSSVLHEGSVVEAPKWLGEAIGHADVSTGYRASVEAIDAELPLRPMSRVSWPRVRGLELGVVEGPADSEYAQIDEHGRYRVKVFADESDLTGKESSTWLRMMQPHAGAPEGQHLPLRKGTEVAVAFVGGDPDRPVIAGALPNAENPSPVTAANHTQNVIQTGGRTRIEIEDQDGKQHIWITTPTEDSYLHLGEPFDPPTHNVVVHTRADNLYDIGGGQDIDVGGALTETVAGDVSETYNATQKTKVSGPQTTTVSGAVTELYGATHDHSVVGGDRSENLTGAHTTIVAGARSETYATHTEIVVGASTETFSATHTRTVGATTETHAAALTETSAGSVIETFASFEEDYRATSSLIANLAWVASSISINAPNWTLTAPNQFRWADFSDCAGAEAKTSSVSVGATVLKLEATGVAASATIMKLERTGFEMAVTGLSLESGGFRISLTAMSLHVVGTRTMP